MPEKAFGGGPNWQNLFTSAQVASSIASTVFHRAALLDGSEDDEPRWECAVCARLLLADCGAKRAFGACLAQDQEGAGGRTTPNVAMISGARVQGSGSRRNHRAQVDGVKIHWNEPTMMRNAISVQFMKNLASRSRSDLDESISSALGRCYVALSACGNNGRILCYRSSCCSDIARARFNAESISHSFKLRRRFACRSKCRSLHAGQNFA